MAATFPKLREELEELTKKLGNIFKVANLTEEKVPMLLAGVLSLKQG